MSLYEEAWEKLRARILPSHDPNCWHSAKSIIKMMDECLGEAEKEAEEAQQALMDWYYKANGMKTKEV